MTRRITMAMLATMAVGVSPIAAQVAHEQHHMPAASAQEMGMASMMMGMMMSSPAALLKSADRLELDDAQRARLAELSDMVAREHGQLIAAMKTTMTQAIKNAKAVLTPQQLEVLEAEMSQMTMDSMMGMMGAMDMSGMMNMMDMCHAMTADPSVGEGAHGHGGND